MSFAKVDRLSPIGGGRSLFPIQYHGTYDFERLVKDMTNYLISRDYTAILKEHSEAVKPSGKEMRIEWEFYKDVNDYIRYEMHVIITVYRQVDVTIEIDGKKKNAQKGDLDVAFDCHVVKNYRKTFGNSKFQKLLKYWYEKFVIKQKIFEHFNYVKYECEELIHIAKTNLGLI